MRDLSRSGSLRNAERLSFLGIVQRTSLPPPTLYESGSTGGVIWKGIKRNKVAPGCRIIYNCQTCSLRLTWIYTMRPSISVIIPFFNGSRFIGDALATVRAQTYAPHEII